MTVSKNSGQVTWRLQPSARFHQDRLSYVHSMKCHTSNRSARWGRRLWVVNERNREVNVFNYVEICLNILNYSILSLKKLLGLCCVFIEFVGWKTYASNCTPWIQNWFKLAKNIDHFSHPKTVAVYIVSCHLTVARHLWLVEFHGISHRGMTVAELFQWQWLNFFNPFECSVLWVQYFFWGYIPETRLPFRVLQRSGRGKPRKSSGSPCNVQMRSQGE